MRLQIDNDANSLIVFEIKNLNDAHTNVVKNRPICSI